MENLIFIGPCGGGKIPTNGASVKNHHLVHRLKELGRPLSIVDTENWRRNPLVLLKLLNKVLLNPRAKYVLSANSKSAYKIIRILNAMPGGRKVYYWVIGGVLANWIKQGRMNPAPYRKLKKIMVEGESMRATMAECGINNAITVPNFKHIDFIPKKKSHQGDNVRRFVFLSRIIPQKGCDYIIEAAGILNEKCEGKFIVDFYGKIEKDYQDIFLSKIERLPNVTYKGFLDLRDTQNYATLSQYDVMLFPTFWIGEGFPGIIIDAFIAGLPVIATDWNLNKDILKEGDSVCFIPPRDGERLAEAMAHYITLPAPRLAEISASCQREAAKYDTDQVLTSSLFARIGI